MAKTKFAPRNHEMSKHYITYVIINKHAKRKISVLKTKYLK